GRAISLVGVRGANGRKATRHLAAGIAQPALRSHTARLDRPGLCRPVQLGRFSRAAHRRWRSADPSGRAQWLALHRADIPPAGALAEEDVDLESFTFTPEQPGDARILTELAKGLPTGDYRDTYLQCMGDTIAVHGTDGKYWTRSHPE